VSTATPRATVDLASELEPQLVAWRRDFHRNPEPGFGEFRTAATLVRELTALGFDLHVGTEAMDPRARFFVHEERVAASWERARADVDTELLSRMEGGLTAVVAELRMGDGPTVAFRADIDALPVTESTEPGHRPVDEGFASTRPGLMHACGHDGHMAIGLGVATVLARRRESLNGTVRFLFQPAEEGTLGGAAAIAARGFADDVDAMLCFHLGLGARSGELWSRASFLATSKYRVEYSGTAAHVTNSPETGRNALLASAQAALAFHGLPPSSKGWYSVNVGVLHAGEEQGVTPRHASMELGFWAENDEVHDWVDARLHELVQGTAAAYGCGVDIRLIGRAPTCPEDAELAAIVRSAAANVPGFDRIEDEIDCRAGEDACQLIKQTTEAGGRGVYMLIGSDLASGHHTSTFDFDEASLAHGTSVLAETASRILSRRA
jgi:aminobenzoyl-glutamate utilization protein A